MLPPRGLAAQRPVCRKHLTQITAVLALTANSSAASRSSTFDLRNHSLPHLPRIGLWHRPASQKRINADSLSHPRPHENPPDSIGAEHALEFSWAAKPETETFGHEPALVARTCSPAKLLGFLKLVGTPWCNDARRYHPCAWHGQGAPAAIA